MSVKFYFFTNLPSLLYYFIIVILSIFFIFITLTRKILELNILCIYGEPGGVRTPDPRLRRPVLYPAELLTHIFKRINYDITKSTACQCLSLIFLFFQKLDVSYCKTTVFVVLWICRNLSNFVFLYNTRFKGGDS